MRPGRPPHGLDEHVAGDGLPLHGDLGARVGVALLVTGLACRIEVGLVHGAALALELAVGSDPDAEPAAVHTWVVAFGDDGGRHDACTR